MTITKTIQRQPTKFDYASPTQFKFQLTKLPKVEYFTTACNIPGISLNATVQPTPLADIPLPGDTLTFGDLEQHNTMLLVTKVLHLMTLVCSTAHMYHYKW